MLTFLRYWFHGQFIFYDTIHPTSRVHELLGLAAFDAVVPEPGMHMILLIGAVMFGVARRRVRGQ